MIREYSYNVDIVIELDEEEYDKEDERQNEELLLKKGGEAIKEGLGEVHLTYLGKSKK